MTASKFFQWFTVGVALVFNGVIALAFNGCLVFLICTNCSSIVVGSPPIVLQLVPMRVNRTPKNWEIADILSPTVHQLLFVSRLSNIWSCFTVIFTTS